MKTRITILWALAMTGLITYSCTHESDTEADRLLEQSLNSYSPTGSHEWYVMPASDDFANLPNQDPKNPVTDAKAKLGKMLFFETGIALDPKNPVSMSTYSCSTCHVPEKSFTAGRFQGIADGAIGFGEHGEGRFKNPLYAGDDVDAQGARPLPMLNLTYITNALWAGTFGSFDVNAGTESVWNQDTLIAINHDGRKGLEANNERALIVHRQMINKDICDSLGYTAMFDEAFPNVPVSERYSLKYGAFAIAAFHRTMLTNQAPFQKWLKGDKSAMTDAQKRGAQLFFGKAGCVSCHNSPSLNSIPHKFFALGVKDLYQMYGSEVFRTGPTEGRVFGRGGFTKKPEDMYKFKVPQLYNMKDIGFYFHGASKRTLREVVEYFNNGIPENPAVPASQISGLIRPLGMTNEEMNDLVEFLANGLYDPNLKRYVPSQTMSENCFPNNDVLSRREMGCN